MTNCPQCGAVEQNGRFCVQCGAALPAPAPYECRHADRHRARGVRHGPPAWAGVAGGTNHRSSARSAACHPSAPPSSPQPARPFTPPRGLVDRRGGRRRRCRDLGDRGRAAQSRNRRRLGGDCCDRNGPASGKSRGVERPHRRRAATEVQRSPNAASGAATAATVSGATVSAAPGPGSVASVLGTSAPAPTVASGLAATQQAAIPCGNAYIVQVASELDQAAFAARVSAVQSANQLPPGAKWTQTSDSCAIFTSQINALVLYSGPYASPYDACPARLASPPDAFIKGTTPATVEHLRLLPVPGRGVVSAGHPHRR